MTRYWNSLRARERQLVLVGATALLLLFAYAIVWAPLADRTDALRTTVEAERDTLNWMRQAASEVVRLRGRDSPTESGGPLLTRVDTVARAQGLADAIKRVQPEGSDSVRVWIEGAAFDAVLRWLHQLNAGGVQVTSLVVDPTDAPGSINARITVAGGGA